MLKILFLQIHVLHAVESVQKVLLLKYQEQESGSFWMSGLKWFFCSWTETLTSCCVLFYLLTVEGLGKELITVWIISSCLIDESCWVSAQSLRSDALFYWKASVLTESSVWWASLLELLRYISDDAFCILGSATTTFSLNESLNLTKKDHK